MSAEMVSDVFKSLSGCVKKRPKNASKPFMVKIGGATYYTWAFNWRQAVSNVARVTGAAEARGITLKELAEAMPPEQFTAYIKKGKK